MAQTVNVYNKEVELRQWCIAMSIGQTQEEKMTSAQKLFEWITTNSGITVLDGSGSPVK